MGESDRVQVARTPYFFQDPIRAGALLCTLLLMLMKDVPFVVGLLAVGLAQANGIAMIVDLVGRGWSMKWGRRARASLLTNNLAIDWANTSVCTMVGAMFLMRMFGPPELVFVIGTLTLAVGLLPDVRFCRILLPRNVREASAVLEKGYFFRDPIKIGAVCGMAVVCVLDRTSLAFVFVSMALLQLNALLVLIDKYRTEVEVERHLDWIPSELIRMLLARDGQRLMLALLPIGLVPFRLGTSDMAAQWVAMAVGGLIVIPDVFRLMFRIVEGLFGGSAEKAPAKA